jgi:hypothetical protein
MFETIALMEPYLVGLGLVGWELFAGWCLWTSLRSDDGHDHAAPVSGDHVATIRRSTADQPLRTQTAHSRLLSTETSKMESSSALTFANRVDFEISQEALQCWSAFLSAFKQSRYVLS